MFILKNKSKNKVGGKKRQREEISPRCLFLLRVTSMFRMVFSGLPSPTHKDIYKYMYRYMSPTYTRSLGLSCTNSHAHARAKPHKHKTGKNRGKDLRERYTWPVHQNGRRFEDGSRMQRMLCRLPWSLSSRQFLPSAPHKRHQADPRIWRCMSRDTCYRPRFLSIVSTDICLTFFLDSMRLVYCVMPLLDSQFITACLWLWKFILKL